MEQLVQVVEVFSRSLANPEDILMWQLSKASLRAPLTEQAGQIFMYLATKYKGGNVPEDIKVTKLSDFDKSELNNLIERIKRKQDKDLKAFLKKLKGDRLDRQRNKGKQDNPCL